MRLIDADRLLKPSFTDMFDEPVEMNMFSRYAIESQPTVEAIPVEWLLMARDKYNNHGLPKEANFINELIALWGICNETN